MDLKSAVCLKEWSLQGLLSNSQEERYEKHPRTDKVGWYGRLLQRGHNGGGHVGHGSPVQAAFELPEGEKITNLPAIPRAIPQKEAYELYDPKVGKNFDLKNFWMRADVGVRPEFRNAACFGNTFGGVAGACNTFGANSSAAANGKPSKRRSGSDEERARA